MKPAPRPTTNPRTPSAAQSTPPERPGVERRLPDTTITLPPSSEPREETAPAGIWRQVLSSPRAVMALVPLLVLALGVTLTLVGQFALSATSKTMVRERFIEQSGAATLRVEQALARADPVLHELAQLARMPLAADPSQLHEAAARMKNLLVGRSALTQAYLAFPDGRFISIDQSARGLSFQVTQGGRSTSFSVLADRLEQQGVRRSQYDPRVRDWYKLAAEKRRPVWSSPYLFYFNRHPGVTRAEPLYLDDEQTELHAVVGVDINVGALTEFLAASETGDESASSVVFSADGVILAYPAGAEVLAALPTTERTPTYSDLNDPELSALVEKVLALPVASRNRDSLRFFAQGQRMLASVRRLTLDGPHWYVATFAPEANVYAELFAYRARSLSIAGLALALAMGFGWLLARAILDVKRQVVQARAEAVEAREKVRDLGSYRLISLIGEGGMGEVWRARHRLLAREAAVKLIKLGDDAEHRNDEQRERFRREAQAIASLRSRNTVALFDYGVTPGGTLFYAMELLDGIDLSSLVARFGPQSPARVRHILLQVCRSLMEAHAIGLVHRDVKPANIFICREADQVDVVKVLDFGLVFQVDGGKDSGAALAETQEGAPGRQAPEASASPSETGSPGSALDAPTRRLEAPQSSGTQEAGRSTPHISVDLASAEVQARITQPHHHIGTPAFMSPEQALGNAPDLRSDLYSLGCVAWWLLTGHPVFSAPSQLALLVKHIEAAPPDLREVAPEVSPELGDLIHRLLSKSPSDRPQSAQNLIEELRALTLAGTWSDDEALGWWNEHLPEPSRPKANLTIPPFRDAAFVRESKHGDESSRSVRAQPKAQG